ncbi:MAG: sodium:solute symporter family protein [Streptomycetaceae bacterium]|nr:sodium:solute symporter family protein [Streptomycetaceae bacterium]
MNVTFTVALAGMAVIAALGLAGRRGKSTDLSEWTVGKRDFGAMSAWFLQAGEAFTTFTFLGVAGVAFGGGVAATYAIPYIPLSYIGTFFIAPIVWRLGRRHNYITQADYFEERYDSKLMGFVVAVMGVVFLLPYLQLQITGLGSIVQLVTGKENWGDASMVIATALTVVFVLWSGLRGVANTAYLKDVLVILAMVVLVIAIPAHFAGGIGDVFDKVHATRPELLTVHDDGAHGRNWWLTSILVSAIGSAFMTLPHLWPATLAAKNEDVIRKNTIWLPLYQVVIILPIVVGFTGAIAMDKHTKGNSVLLTLTRDALPDWFVGVVAVAAASAAMVPAAALCMGMSTLVARNIVRTRNPRVQLAVNHGFVVVAAGGALLLGLERPNALADLLLLTFSGLAQLAPGFLAVLTGRKLLAKWPVLLGMAAGVTVVWYVEIQKPDVNHINSGILGLIANLAVAIVAQLVHLAVTRGRTGTPAVSAAAPAPQPESVA